MAYIAQCLGLRVSEIAALQWGDFDFEKNQLLVQRSIVNGNVDDVKTEYSQDYVPLHPSLTEVVLGGSKGSVPTEEGWVFANPITEKPYFPTDSEATPPACRMVSGGVSEVRCWFGRLVSAGSPDTKWRSLTDPQGTPSRSREVQLDWLAYLPPYLSFVAGRDRSADEGATGADATRLHPDDDERLWTGHVIIEERSEWKGCGDGAQADESERLKS